MDRTAYLVNCVFGLVFSALTRAALALQIFHHLLGGGGGGEVEHPRLSRLLWVVEKKLFESSSKMITKLHIPANFFAQVKIVASGGQKAGALSLPILPIKGFGLNL